MVDMIFRTATNGYAERLNSPGGLSVETTGKEQAVRAAAKEKAMKTLLCGLTIGTMLLATTGCDELDVVGWGSELLYFPGSSWYSPGYYEEVVVDTYEEEYWVEESYYDEYWLQDDWYW